MFIWRTLLRPMQGRAAVLRQELLDGVRPEDGLVIGTRLFGDGPLFSVNQVAESLKAFADVRGSWEAGWEASLDAAENLGQPPCSELWEVFQPPIAGGTVPRFTIRFTLEAVPGRSRELLETVQRFVDTREASASPSQVWLRVSGGGHAVAMVSGYPGLDALEQELATAPTDPSTRAFGAEAAALATPAQTPEIFEILVPAS